MPLWFYGPPFLAGYLSSKLCAWVGGEGLVHNITDTIEDAWHSANQPLCVYVCECVSGPRHEIEGAGVIGIEVTLKLIPEVEVPLDRAWRKGCVINMPGEGALTFIHKRKCLIFSLGKLQIVLARFLCSLNKRQCNFVKTRALVFHLPINYGLEYALIKI